jgi:cell division septum initiation protein DivIVA
MKNSSVINPTTTTNNTSLTSKVSFADRLLMGEDIETIIEANQDLTVDYSEDLPTTAEIPLQPIETPTERAERGTVKKATLDLYKSLQDAGEVDRSLWAQMAVDKGICKNVRQAGNILRYDFLGIVRVPLDGTIVNRTTLSVLEATEKANEMNEKAAIDAERIISEATAKAEKLISDTFARANNLVELAKVNAERKEEHEAKLAAQSVKKAGEVLKTLESIDTSKVEISPEMRAMMMKMLGMETV